MRAHSSAIPNVTSAAFLLRNKFRSHHDHTQSARRCRVLRHNARNRRLQRQPCCHCMHRAAHRAVDGTQSEWWQAESPSQVHQASVFAACVSSPTTSCSLSPPSELGEYALLQRERQLGGATQRHAQLVRQHEMRATVRLVGGVSRERSQVCERLAATRVGRGRDLLMVLLPSHDSQQAETVQAAGCCAVRRRCRYGGGGGSFRTSGACSIDCAAPAMSRALSAVRLSMSQWMASLKVRLKARSLTWRTLASRRERSLVLSMSDKWTKAL